MEAINLIKLIFKLYSFEIGAIFKKLPPELDKEENYYNEPVLW